MGFFSLQNCELISIFKILSYLYLCLYLYMHLYLDLIGSVCLVYTSIVIINFKKMNVFSFLKIFYWLPGIGSLYTNLPNLPITNNLTLQ